MEIKRNIFESSVRMPRTYEPIASPMEAGAPNAPYLVSNPAQVSANVRHAPSPRIGEKN